MRQVLIWFLLIAIGCSTQPRKEVETSPKVFGVVEKKKEELNLPEDSIWLENKFFRTLYSKNWNIAYFTDYTVTAEELCSRLGQRKDNFKGDVRLKELGLPMPVKSWYYAPYDKGHLAPAADFLRSQDAVDTTFLMSNMTPQKDLFNRRAWESLEEEARGWGIAEGKIRIVTGPILEKGLANLKGHEVSIPKLHFKALLDMTSPKKMIGFIMPQEDSKTGDFKKRVVAVREIEKVIGMNLFDESDELETKSDLSKWKTSKCK